MNRTFAAVSFSKGIEDAWTKVAAFVPKLFAFLVILVIGWFVAKAIAKLINGILERVGFDQAVERGGVKKALERSKYDASDVLGKIVYYAVLLLVLQMAFGVFGTNLVSALIAGVIAFLPKVFAAIIIVIVAAAIAAAAKEIVQSPRRAQLRQGPGRGGVGGHHGHGTLRRSLAAPDRPRHRQRAVLRPACHRGGLGRDRHWRGGIGDSPSLRPASGGGGERPTDGGDPGSL
ncbi:MAG: hypothetical protein M3450_05405 [Actinomycetota bacterium]|nr:hypothetical protein [Actinomycetota bacterium]